MKTIHSFKPIVGRTPRLLILGTMPGAVSLKKKQYYGNTNNVFWRIMYSLFSKGVELSDDYREKNRLLKAHAIALWDVLKECERPTTLRILT